MFVDSSSVEDFVSQVLTWPAATRDFLPTTKEGSRESKRERERESLGTRLQKLNAECIGTCYRMPNVQSRGAWQIHVQKCLSPACLKRSMQFARFLLAKILAPGLFISYPYLRFKLLFKEVIQGSILVMVLKSFGPDKLDFKFYSFVNCEKEQT